MRKPIANMELLAAIVSVAEKGDWTAAADQLSITVSALQKRLRQLSDLTGTQLVEMVQDRVKLTEAGELFYREAVLSLEHAVLAEEKTRAHLLLRENRLLVGHSTYLPPRLLAVIQQLPMDGTVHIEHRTGLTPDMVARVASGTLHAGFGFLPIDSKGLLVRQLLEEPLVACLPSESPVAQRAQIRPQDLDTERFIAVARDILPSLHQEIEDYFQSFGIELRVVADAFSSTEALAYVEQRVGICLLSRSSATPRKGVVVRPLASRALTRRSGLFLREDNRDALIAEFMETVLRKTAVFSRLLL